MSESEKRSKLKAKRHYKSHSPKGKEEPPLLREYKKGTKRGNSDDEESSNKKSCYRSPKTKNLAQNRLTALQENLKKDLERTDLKKKETVLTSKDEKNPANSYKIPRLNKHGLPKNLAAERLRKLNDDLFKKDVTDDEEKKEKDKSEHKATPKKRRNLSSSRNEEKLYTSPLKKLNHPKLISPNIKPSTKTLHQSPEESPNFSKEYIVVSEVSDSEDSETCLTPMNQRLFKLRSNTSGSSSKTVISKSCEKNTRDDCFSTPKGIIAPNKRKFGLKEPLNRNIFKKSTVQTDRDSTYTNTKNVQEKLVGYKDRENPNIFGNDSPSQSNIFGNQNQKNLCETNIFASYSQNNNISPTITSVTQTSHGSPKFGASSVNDRLIRIRNEHKPEKNGANSRMDHVSSTMDVEISQSNEVQISEDQCQKCSKQLLTENWLDTHQCIQKNIDTTISDSLVVNVDDTILNKSDLPDPDDVSMEWETVSSPLEAQPPVLPIASEPKKENVIYIVTDTNIFMHFLHKIRDILNFKVTGSQKVKIYIPWMVLTELDYIKDHSGEPTKSMAHKAGKFINNCLVDRDSKLVGQTVEEMSQQKDIGTSPDDKILATCLQAAEKFETVFLLTNDINLRSKALINNITSCTPGDVLHKLMSKLSKNTKSQKISLKLSMLFSQIICETCKEAYGDAWSKMDMMQNPPWSLIECLKRFKRYWGSVYKEQMLKQCLKTIEEFYDLLFNNKNHIPDDSETFTQFMKLSLGFLVFLQDLQRHKGSVKNTINEIVQLANS